MAKIWEIRGLFGNEFALEGAVEELKKHEGVQWAVLDRRNLSVRLARRDEKLEGVVRRTIDINHGWVESEASLGEFDAMKAEQKRKKMEQYEEKRRKAAKAKAH